MRCLKWLSRSVARWTLALGCVAVGNWVTESRANAHFPFHHHHGCFGSYGWGSHYRGVSFYSGYSGFGGYSSYYGSSSSCFYPSLSFCAPRYYSVNYYTPTYYTPTYYAPVYYAPTYYAPAPCSTWSNVPFSTSIPIGVSGFPVTSAVNSFTAPGFVSSARVSNSAPLAMQTRSIQTRAPLAGLTVAGKLISNRELTVGTTDLEQAQNQLGKKVVSYKPVVLQPYSPIWTKAAVGIVDQMIAAGELDHAHSSCKSMERVTQPKGSGVYLRQALLNYFSTEESSSSKPSNEEILKLLELACNAGSMLQPSELAKDSLQEYFAACSVDVEGKLELLSKSILESPEHSGKELLLLSALMKLEGQDDRAKLFATSAAEQAAKSSSFRWNSVLNVCLN